jgi:hypothetical protein
MRYFPAHLCAFPWRIEHVPRVTVKAAEPHTPSLQSEGMNFILGTLLHTHTIRCSEITELSSNDKSDSLQTIL